MLWFERYIGAEDDRKGNNQGSLGARKVDFTKIIPLLNCWDSTKMAPLVDRRDVGKISDFSLSSFFFFS